MKNILSTIVTVVLVLVGVYYIVPQKYTEQVFRGVDVGNQYQSTTTPQVADLANLCQRPSGVVQRSTGVLGTVNILNANGSALTIIDATTTNVNMRSGNLASSTLILAEFPGNQTEGSYVFDIETKYGILIDYASIGTSPTSTISYRCEG